MLTITYEKLLEIYFQNPQFGYYFLVLTSQRLLENISRLEAIIAQNKSHTGGCGCGRHELSAALASCRYIQTTPTLARSIPKPICQDGTGSLNNQPDANRALAGTAIRTIDAI